MKATELRSLQIKHIYLFQNLTLYKWFTYFVSNGFFCKNNVFHRYLEAWIHMSHWSIFNGKHLLLQKGSKKSFPHFILFYFRILIFGYIYFLSKFTKTIFVTFLFHNIYEMQVFFLLQKLSTCQISATCPLPWAQNIWRMILWLKLSLSIKKNYWDFSILFTKFWCKHFFWDIKFWNKEFKFLKYFLFVFSHNIRNSLIPRISSTFHNIDVSIDNVRLMFIYFLQKLTH